MKKAGNFKAKKTGVVNTVVEGKPGDDASAASSVTISGSERNRYQRFLGVCRDDLVELFNTDEEKEFDEGDAGFAFDFCIVGDVILIDVIDVCTSRNCISVSDVAKFGGLTFTESKWKRQG